MGCTPSVNKTNQKDQAKNDVIVPVTESQRAQVNPTNPKDFHVTATDFVKTKNTKFRDEYIIKNRLGEGAYGEVRKVGHKASGLIRAVKILKKNALDAQERTKMINELQILTKLDHPNIMRVYETFEEGDKYYIVSEYLEGGELFDKLETITRFSEKDAAKIMKQLFSAVSYTHQHNIVHRDLKLENLVYESRDKDATLKVIDFGTAGTFKPNQQMDEPFGTAYYIAPEMLNSTYTEKCDIWSCGVILYLLLSGAYPINGKNEAEIIKNVSAGKYAFSDKLWAKISPEAKAFVQKLLEIDPKKRYSAEQALQDPWIKAAINEEQGTFNEPIDSENLLNLKKLRFKTKFQEAAWVFLVSYFGTKEEREKLLETFKGIDKNQDGQLTKEELKQSYIQIMKLSDEAAGEEAEKTMESLDKNKNGKIDYSEFVSATISKKNLLVKEKLEAAFKLFDKSGDGKISGEEMRFLFNEGRVNGLPANVWNEWIGQVDKNGDQGISIEEFKEMMMSLMTDN